MPIDQAAPKNKPETAQMVVIHKGLRREFKLLPTLVAEVPDGDTGQARRLARHAELLLTFLHSHHDSEDRMLWPILAKRIPPAKDLAATMEEQHQTMSHLFAPIRLELADWSVAAAAPARRRLAYHLAGLDIALGDHLDAEEGEILPLVHEHLTVPEWEAIQADAQQHMPKNPRVGLVIAGMVLEDATPAEQAWFLGELPAAARLMWRLAGRSMYAAYLQRVRGRRPGATGWS